MRGRPGRARDFQRRHSRKPWRCHPTTVVGETIRSASFHPAQRRDSQTQNRRSHGRSRGLGADRRRTASCWRRARFSSASWLCDSRSRRSTHQTPCKSPMCFCAPPCDPCEQIAGDPVSRPAAGRSKTPLVSLRAAGLLRLRDFPRIAMLTPGRGPLDQGGSRHDRKTYPSTMAFCHDGIFGRDSCTSRRVDGVWQLVGTEPDDTSGPQEQINASPGQGRHGGIRYARINFEQRGRRPEHCATEGRRSS